MGVSSAFRRANKSCRCFHSVFYRRIKLFVSARVPSAQDQPREWRNVLVNSTVSYQFNSCSVAAAEWDTFPKSLLFYKSLHIFDLLYL